jgi:Tfp pilus assembly protein PilO
MNFSSWDKLPIKQQITVFGVITILIAYLLYIFILEPQWTQIDTLKTQHQAEKQKVKVVEDFVRNHPDIEGYIFELDTKIVSTDKMLPDSPDISSFVLQMEQLAKDTGVELSYLKPGKTDNKQGYRELSVEMSVKGSFAGMMSFLRKTEEGARYMNIGTISTQISKDGLESKMLAKIYSHGVPTPPAPAAPKK